MQEAIIRPYQRWRQHLHGGDVKQSIYRFRRAKPELFLDKYKRFALAGEARGRPEDPALQQLPVRAEILHGVVPCFPIC